MASSTNDMTCCIYEFIVMYFFSFSWINVVQVRYRSNTPLVLKGITIGIRGGEKIGVVGRTGSGKSTLIQVFFRLVEPCGGKIVIDGVDICKMGLHDLRSRFGIIPQEPVLFQGTVRSNVDPLGLYSEEEIWKVFPLSSSLTWYGTPSTLILYDFKWNYCPIRGYTPSAPYHTIFYISTLTMFCSESFLYCFGKGFS